MANEKNLIPFTKNDPRRHTKQKGEVSITSFLRKHAKKRTVAMDMFEGCKRRMTLGEQASLKLWIMALDGDLGAIKELHERLEGKVTIPVNHAGANGAPLIPTQITFVGVDPIGNTNTPQDSECPTSKDPV